MTVIGPVPGRGLVREGRDFGPQVTATSTAFPFIEQSSVASPKSSLTAGVAG